MESNMLNIREVELSHFVADMPARKGRKRSRSQRSHSSSSSEQSMELSTRHRLEQTSTHTSNNSLEMLSSEMLQIVQQLSDHSANSVTPGDVIPPFYPEDGSQNIEEWCAKIDQLRKLFSWSDPITVYHVLGKLKGLAETWYRSLPSIKYTWAEWKLKLAEAFPSCKDYCAALEEMLAKKKLPQDSYTQYYFEKLNLLNQCKIKGKDAVSCMIGGLTDTRIKASAKAADFNTPMELYSYLRNLSNEEAGNSGNAKGNPNKNLWLPVSKKTKPERPARKCYNCRKFGHLASNCQEARASVCRYCKKMGHIENTCYKKAREIVARWSHDQNAGPQINPSTVNPYQ